jgi:hypothetical protein
MSKTLRQAVGEAVSFDLGPKGILIGMLELREESRFVGYKQGASGKVEVRKVVYNYALVPQGKSFWYNLGAVDSPFDNGCTVDEQNRINYREVRVA